MAQSDMIEIIDPAGQIAFHDLDPQQGTTNIGRHSTNNIVIDAPGIAPFHAVLDHQRKPYQIMALGEGGQVRVRGEALPANVFQELHDWDSVDIEGHTLILLESGAEALPAGEPAPGEQGTPGGPAGRPGVAPGVTPAAPAGALADQLIVLDLPVREWTVDVEQTASCQLTITNGGPLVAIFSIAVEGLPASWVTISPPKVELFAGEKSIPVTVSITAPRRPSSRAGVHPLTIHVGSAQYPGHVSRVTAVLTLNPYYEFGVDPLVPKEQTVSYRRRSGRAELPVANKGNSKAAVRLEAVDSQKACSFEFLVPGETAGRFQKAEVYLEPEEKLAVPITITPSRRRLVGLRKHTHDYTVTAGLAESSLLPFPQQGILKIAPLIGPVLIALLLLLFAGLFVFLFRPVGVPFIGVADRSETRPGSPVQLNYDASRFASLSPANLFNQLNSAFLKVTLQVRPETGDWQIAKSPSELARPTGGSTETPTQNVKYRLLTSSIVPFLRGTSREIPVYVTPVEPRIVIFESDKDEIIAGDTATIYWQVSDAETLVLEHDGIQDSLTDAELISGHRSYPLDKDTTFTLTAGNSTWAQPVKKSLTVRVVAPTPTPIPTPVIIRFDVNPLEITRGETVRLSWQVAGADTVSIDPLGTEFLLQGDMGDQPATLTTYRLTAHKVAPDGTEAKNSVSSQVFVKEPPPPTPEPLAPVVEFFEGSPAQVIAGQDNMVTLTWAVQGQTTNIQITGGAVPLTGLSPNGSMGLNVTGATVFVLTAYNGTLNSSKIVQISAVQPTPTPKPTPEPPRILSFVAEADPAGTYDPGNNAYRILEDAKVTLSWELSGDIDKIVLITVEGRYPGSQEVGTEPKYMGAIDTNTTYQLVVTNASGSASKTLYLVIAARDLPPPENFLYNFSTRVFAWTYAQPNEIEGFRLYRNPGQRDLVASTPGLPDSMGTYELPGPQDEYRFVLPDGECGTFFLVAVYKDPYNNEAWTETDAAEDSWGVPCP